MPCSGDSHGVLSLPSLAGLALCGPCNGEGAARWRERLTQLPTLPERECPLARDTAASGCGAANDDAAGGGVRFKLISVPLKEWRTFAPEVRAVLCLVFKKKDEHGKSTGPLPTNLAKVNKLPTSKVRASSYGTGGQPARGIISLRK